MMKMNTLPQGPLRIEKSTNMIIAMAIMKIVDITIGTMTVARAETSGMIESKDVKGTIRAIGTITTTRVNEC